MRCHRCGLDYFRPRLCVLELDFLGVLRMVLCEQCIYEIRTFAKYPARYQAKEAQKP